MTTPEQRRTIRFWAGLLIGAVGLVCAVVGMRAHDHGLTYTGFVVALVGAGIVPLDRIADVLPWGPKR
jgi:hypothetical protein